VFPLDSINLPDFVTAASGFLATLSDTARDMDGRAAFFLGAVSWFLVEQAVRRLAGMLRWAILGAALAGGGVAAVGAFGLLADHPQAAPVPVAADPVSRR